MESLWVRKIRCAGPGSEKPLDKNAFTNINNTFYFKIKL